MSPSVERFLQSEFLRQELCLATEDGCGEDDCALCLCGRWAVPNTWPGAEYPGLLP
jgi:hypothetical protein